MGLGAALRNLQVTQTDTTSGESRTDTIITDMGVGGGWADWSDGTQYRGMGVPGAWRAAILCSDLLGSLPWHGFREGPDGLAEQIIPTPDLLDQPAPPETRMTSMSSLALDLIWHGNAIMIKAGRDPYGAVRTAVPVPVELVTVRRVKGRDEFGLRPGDVAYDVGGTIFGSADVIHIKGPCKPGALRGMGVIEAHANGHGALALAAELARQAAAVGQSAVPTGKLKVSVPDLTQAESDILKASWMRAQRDRTVAVLNSTTDFEPLAWNPTETQLIEARKFSLHETALLFGLDPSWLGAAQSSRVYANIEQEGITLLRYSALAGHLARFEQALTLAMPPGESARANLDSILRADTAARYTAHQVGIVAGFLTVNEARALEQLPPLSDAELAALKRPPPAAPPGREVDDGPPDSRSSREILEQRGRGKGDGGGDESDLYVYWTAGAGKARWASSPTPLLALYELLTAKGMPADRARQTALAWLPDALGRPVKPSDGEIPT